MEWMPLTMACRKRLPSAAYRIPRALRRPGADRLRRLGRTRGAHVVDAGESSVASYVTYAEYHNGRKQLR